MIYFMIHNRNVIMGMMIGRAINFNFSNIILIYMFKGIENDYLL